MMRILFAGHQGRGIGCLEALYGAGHAIVGVIAHRPVGNHAPVTLAGTARRLDLPLFEPADVNAPSFIEHLQTLEPDVTVLAGYGPIVRRPFIEIAPHGCVNLHGGRLPEYRGSSPMNWALINGEREFGISIIQVDSGVDTGDVLADRLFPVGEDATIADLQAIANQHFPDMLLQVLRQIETGSLQRRVQDETRSAYYPLRLPEDGLICWDLMTADQVHNAIRALTDPYPGAFSYLGSRRVRLLASRRTKRPVFGNPGRIYRKSEHGLLVCAADRCLWLRRAVFEDTGEPVFDAVGRYESFMTVRAASMRVFAEPPANVGPG